MKIVRVIYTTTKEFADTNSRNIRGVIAELKELAHPGISYSAYLSDDGKTFMHFDQFENDAAHQLLVSLASFKKFDRETIFPNIAKNLHFKVFYRIITIFYIKSNCLFYSFV